MKYSLAWVASLAALSTLALQRPAARAPAGPAAFRDAALESGLDFRHFTGSTGEFYMPEIMGAGVALVDYDNDGDLDVYLLQGAMLDPARKPSEARFPPRPGRPRGNRLFRNDLVPSGKLHFTDVTERAGVGHEGYGMGVAAGDYDNDGDTDLYVTNFGSNVLYRNNGDGTFSDVTREAGVDDPRWSTSASWLDYDRDGRLDLFVCNYVDFTVRGNKRCQAATGEPDYCTPAIYRPVPDRLFHNDGNGRFSDVTQRSGIGGAFGPGLGVVAADFDLDGWIDLYVANDGAANLLWINRRDGTFQERGLVSGAAYGEDGVARAGMGVAAGDYDLDGDDDIVVTNLRREGATIFRNDGRARFTDASAEAGVGAATFPFTGFGVGWLDYDGDGRLDLLVCNGAVTILEALRGGPYPFRQRSLLLHNEGEGVRLREALLVAPVLEEVSRGAAFGDVDNDGRIDLVVSNNNGPARLLLNRSEPRGHWLSVRAEGVACNRPAFGARVTAFLRDGKRLVRRVASDGSYCSASDSRVHFGLGAAAAIDRVEVAWPDGTRESWTGVRSDAAIALRQGTGSALASAAR